MKKEYNKVSDEIAYSQALNLAVQYLSMFPDKFKTAEKRMEAIREAREWFYEELCKMPPRTAALGQPEGEVPTRPRRTYKSEKQEMFLRAQDEVMGELETPATVDAVVGVDGARGGQFEG